jgi:hypothetical protein
MRTLRWILGTGVACWAIGCGDNGIHDGPAGASGAGDIAAGTAGVFNDGGAGLASGGGAGSGGTVGVVTYSGPDAFNPNCGGGALPAPGPCHVCERVECVDELNLAFGSGWSDAVPGGACEAWIECVHGCNCGDMECGGACLSLLDEGECDGASSSLSQCRITKCDEACTSGG